MDSLDIEATLAEIRQAPAGEEGDPVVVLPLDNACSADGTDAAVLQAIVDDPPSFYVQVATDVFPEGAIRGQLRNEDIASLRVFHHACPPAIQTAAMIDRPEDCASALGRSDLPPTPGGLSYDPQPILFDVSLTLTDPARDTFTGSAESREPFCTATACTIGNVGYGFDDGEHGGYNLAGPTLLQADSSSDGYRLGAVWALDHLGADGDLPLPLEVDLDARRITFDSTGAGNVQVRLFYFAAPDATEGPAASEGPAATVPPTTTASISPDPDDVALAAVLVLPVIAFASLLAAIRTLPRGR
jgi:hypothetical protein